MLDERMAGKSIVPQFITQSSSGSLSSNRACDNTASCSLVLRRKRTGHTTLEAPDDDPSPENKLRRIKRNSDSGLLGLAAGGAASTNRGLAHAAPPLLHVELSKSAPHCALSSPSPVICDQ